MRGTSTFRTRCCRVSRYKATWKREFKLPWRKAGLLLSMIKWTRTSRLSIKISLSLYYDKEAAADAAHAASRYTALSPKP